MGNHVLWTHDEKDHSACYQQQVQELSSMMVWDCIGALGKGNLHIFDGNINAERTLRF